MTDQPIYLTVRQAAERWGLHPTRIHALIHAGRIPGAIKPGHDWLIPEGPRPPILKGGHKTANQETTMNAKLTAAQLKFGGRIITYDGVPTLAIDERNENGFVVTTYLSSPLSFAQHRYANTPELQPFGDIIFYDWPNWDEHLDWIATAPTAEIVDWAETIRAS